ncbi:hypothetical protein [Ketogulonicigenium vulgare]|uniref:hypothetical protein n=1 Tax=Ketogulonicigenium vulgare TaxID=92945 RepID=UPI0012EA22BC|nr:hypothetical protein [Ketogulonicigenium vulgare]
MAIFAPVQPEPAEGQAWSSLRSELMTLIQDFHLTDDISLERMFDRIEETETLQ